MPGRAPIRPTGPAGGGYAPPSGPSVGFGPRDVVEKSDLPPLEASATDDGSALVAISREIPVPVKSAGQLGLLLRLANLTEPAAMSAEAAVARAAMLYKAGRTGEADAGVTAYLEKDPAPIMTAMSMRLALSVGDRDRACANVQTLIPVLADLPAAVKAETMAMQGYCGAAAGNPAAAGLAAQLAREQGGISEATLSALDAIAAGDAPALAATGRISVFDWRLAEASGKAAGLNWPVDRFEPAALRAVGMSTAASPALRLAAAEAAARFYALDPVELADVYRQQPFSAADLAQGQAAKVDGPMRRALLFKAAEADRTPLKRTRLVRAALDDARRAGLYRQVAAALARTVEEIRPVAEVGWFTETAVEVLVAGGRFDVARRWLESAAALSPGDGRPGNRALLPPAYWGALVDIAEAGPLPSRGASLVFVEEAALRGRFTPEGLHRLATVLDALDYHVPIRLWEAASRAPQPTQGFLPATGVLAELQDAVRKRDTLQVTALMFKVLGPDGPEGAHMIALGDAVRALRRVGLEVDARAVAFDALFGLWPRGSSS